MEALKPACGRKPGHSDDLVSGALGDVTARMHQASARPITFSKMVWPVCPRWCAALCGETEHGLRRSAEKILAKKAEN